MNGEGGARRDAALPAELSDSTAKEVSVTSITARTPEPYRRREGETWRQLLARIYNEQHEIVKARRARVLSHPDLAAKLTAPPLSYADPKQWNGFVPPATWGDRTYPDGSWKPLPNTSPLRAALVDISTEAMNREQEPRCG